MRDKLISVIIPTYNRANLIEFAIKSVLNQSYKNIELIIVDDGSTDSTKKIIDSFKDHRIKYIKQKHSGLPAVARNTGLKNARGEFIAFLDSDDIWFPQKLEKQIKLFYKQKSAILIATNAIIINSKFQKVGKRNLKSDKFLSYKDLLENNIVINSTVLFKKNVINKIGYLDSNPLAVGIEDLDYWLRILKYKHNSIFMTKEILCFYKKDDDSLLRSLSPIKRYLRHKYLSTKHEYDEVLLAKRARINLTMKFLIDLEMKRISIKTIRKKKILFIEEKIKILITHYSRKRKLKNRNLIFRILNLLLQIFLIIVKNFVLIIKEKNQ
ncbi:MAG: glycosyltransferase family 2 protein [Promethearchaeota archaeon]